MCNGGSFIRFAFWNIENKDLSREVVDLCKENSIDVLILSEHQAIDENIIKSRLTDHELSYKFEYMDKQNRVILIKKSDVNCSIIVDGFRYSGYSITLKNGIEINLFGVHFPSKLYKDESQSALYCSRIKSEFENIEKERGSKNSIIVGDFNINPFSLGMVDVYAFNSVMSKEIALKEKRIVDGQDHYYYYNPMWHLMGNRKNEVLGTYYLHNNQTSYVWNTIDQVILRPSLINFFDEDKLKIITQISKYKLLNNKGVPDQKKYSDHLPIMFEIEEAF